MNQDQIIKRLRAATEDDVTRAYAGALIDRAGSVDLLEFFNRMIDVMIGEEET